MGEMWNQGHVGTAANAATTDLVVPKTMTPRGVEQIEVGTEAAIQLVYPRR
jgi:hypothetical protein